MGVLVSGSERTQKMGRKRKIKGKGEERRGGGMVFDLGGMGRGERVGGVAEEEKWGENRKGKNRKKENERKEKKKEKFKIK